MTNTVTRLVGYGSDWSSYSTEGIQGDDDAERLAIYELGENLWRERFPCGIGYMNFPIYFESFYRYEMTLHNTYQAWATECGILGVLTAIWLLGSYFVGLRRCFARTAGCDDGLLRRAFAVAMIVVLVGGVYHQIHQMPLLFMLLGCTAGLRHKHGN